MKKVFAFALVLSLLGVLAMSQDALARRGGTCPDDNPKRSADCSEKGEKGEKAGLVDQIAKRGAETEKGEKGEKGEGVEKVG